MQHSLQKERKCRKQHFLKTLNGNLLLQKILYFNDVYFLSLTAKDDLTDKIDFIICLGGDGTLLHASTLFQVIIVTVNFMDVPAWLFF